MSYNNSSKQTTLDDSNRRRTFSSLNDDDIENLLDSLRIDRDRRDIIVGDAFGRGLNPGERRRLELGLLVLGAPDMLFCENPVVGLDSETSLHVMEFLKGYIANSNRRIIVTLDKPSLFVWNLIDNVILLSKGRIAYEGPRFDMEAFFAYNKMPTPKRFSPLEHYLATISNFRRGPDAAVNWETAFKQWQEEGDREEGDDLADDIEICFPTYIPDVIIPHHGRNEGEVLCCCSEWCHKFTELLRRYLINIFRNPGMLVIRLVMYTFLSLLLGALFFNLGRDNSSQAMSSRVALLFYSSSFYIFMVVAVMPFQAHDLNIRNGELLNSFYHPITHHLAVTVASIPAVLILSLVITIILIGMVKLQNATTFFVIFTLALWNAELYSLLISLCVKNYMLAVVVLAGIFGCSMALEGFMLIPSMFPAWLKWTYPCPFHTYVFRSLTYSEFHGTPYGEALLVSLEIEDTDVEHDMVVLFLYSMVIQLACLAVLLLDSSSPTMNKKVKES